MLGSDAIYTEGVIVETMSARLFKATLINGHILLVYPPAQKSERGMELAIGKRVKLKIGPFIHPKCN